jgi:light-harvesting complex II chlorophyll a/b binding protein 5
MQSLATSTFVGTPVVSQQQITRSARGALVVQAAKKKAAPAKSGKGGAGTQKWLGGRVDDFGSELSSWYGPGRKLYLPGGLLEPADIPSYLNGTLAGDYGYDPLSLGTDAATVAKYREYELLHARWAMLGVAGCFIPEGLAANGADIPGATWFETGMVLLKGDSLNYFAAPWYLFSNPLPLAVVAVIQIVLIGGAEKYRSEGEGPAGYAPGVGNFDESIFTGLDSISPGGPFDPLGLADDPATFQELQVKEIKNGRAAMIAMLGFALQAAVTGEGPYANWSKHVADPFGYNLLTILGQSERTPTF